MSATAKKVSLSGWFRQFILRLVKAFAWLISVVVIGIAVCLGLLWLEHRTPITLPAPTGKFMISRATYNWIDTEQTGRPAPIARLKQELVVWIWYPSTGRRSGGMVDDYMPKPWRTAAEQTRGPLMSNFLTRDLAKVHGHSIINGNISPELKTYPLVIMRPGLSALTLEYSAFAEDLSSHGYIVVGFDAPYRTSLVVLPGGRVITRAPENNPEIFSAKEQDRILSKLMIAWCADTRFVLDQLERLNTVDPSGRFKGRIDMSRIGFLGTHLAGRQQHNFATMTKGARQELI
ncbi:MAG TPA: hypothetical protein VK668_04320 [Mucilaginibacter sp.]|nr:hypothetical protein [Mucilaginibacter sp.]